MMTIRRWKLQWWGRGWWWWWWCCEWWWWWWWFRKHLGVCAPPPLGQLIIICRPATALSQPALSASTYLFLSLILCFASLWTAFAHLLSFSFELLWELNLDTYTLTYFSLDFPLFNSVQKTHCLNMNVAVCLVASWYVLFLSSSFVLICSSLCLVRGNDSQQYSIKWDLKKNWSYIWNLTGVHCIL